MNRFGRLVICALVAAAIWSPLAFAAITVPVYGVGNNPTAPLWSQQDCVPTSEWSTPAALTGGHTMYLYRVPQSITAADGALVEFAEAHERDSDFACRAIY